MSVLRDRLRTHYGSQWPLRVSLIEFRDDHIRQYLARSFAGSVLSEVGFIWPGMQADSLSVMRKLSTPESLPVLDADLFFFLCTRKNRRLRNFTAPGQRTHCGNA
ncbi:hypothetical protein [Candidatus Symbiopectobacterium sp.]|uniref:hypothetical protein n=1 Tax=Candidatus Symbiopectobacterium sp. TaxID=2816440 RepID=UPI0025B88BD3|nr:hypothetical protein [Candidatus Symbiopectobacterium sp.]